MAPTNDHADDAVTIAPDMHEIIFEDGSVRALKVTVPAGASAAMHWHPRNTNYVLSAGRLRFTKPDGSSFDVVLNDGQITSSPEGSHAVENIGDTEVQTMQTEIKG